MRGPLPPDSFSGRAERDPLGECLTRGQRYRVQKRFIDLDGTVHRPGQEWFFVGSCYSRYDRLLTIFVADDDTREWAIELHWDKVVDDFRVYVASIAGQIREEYFATARCPECGSQRDRSCPSKCPKCHRVLSLA
jgi:hypothetical protein